MTTNRRSFLKASAVTAAAAATAGLATACTTERRDDASRAGGTLDGPLLDATAQVVLPKELGATGIASAVAAFRAWVAGYEPAAEEMHGYGDQSINYTPAHPAPHWNAQLQQMDALARKRHGTGFAQLDAARREALVRGQLAGLKGGEHMPGVLGAPHVALALLAHWAGSPAATDFVYGAQIGKDTCRTLATVTAAPAKVTA
ncbi:MAG: twin-arginine translocation signal domain-containing protein [Gemmatimonadetes bacterium]|nr:twin-arginine translocation signal domain-containing protein [Gemmatimonadota bacterium]